VATHLLRGEGVQNYFPAIEFSSEENLKEFLISVNMHMLFFPLVH
jgi:hypothetical protein